MSDNDTPLEADSEKRTSFDDLYLNNNKDSLIQKERIEEPKPKVKEAPKKKGKSFVELLTGDADIGNFARQLNLDPEMSEKLLIPLLSLLDKYKIGENVTANPRIESAVSAFEIIKDVAPVIKGAAEFVSGKKAELEADDVAYLEAIRQSQNVTDASLFEDDEELFLMSEDAVEAVAPPPQPVQQAPTPSFDTFGQSDWSNFFSAQTGHETKDPLDNALTRELDELNDAVKVWTAQQQGGINVSKQDQNKYDLEVPSMNDMITGMPDTITGMMNTEFAIIDVSKLAAESGLSVNAVMESDSQRAINNDEEEFNVEPFDLEELQPVENPLAVDYSIVPQDAEEYDPFSVAGFEIPAFSASDIEEIENVTKVGE